VKLSHLREFITLAETMEYTVAARKLLISQALLSKHIRHLESEFGVTLFNRTTRKVELSEFGALLLPYARDVVDTEREYLAVLARHAVVGGDLLELVEELGTS
jgi:LysR family transcriptional activator of glutamate synthase operon